jgi:hypothetical protein
MKCGTTTLAAQLGAQDDIFMTTPKEPNFFSDDCIYVKGDAWYENLFADARPGDLRGEASTHYTKLPTHPEAIARLMRTGLRPRLIYLIRDPIDRIVSHYIHEWTMGVITCDLDAAIEKHPEMLSYSLYGNQLSPWIDAFGVQSLMVLTLEDMNRYPQDVLQQVGRFLGLPDIGWRDDLTRENASAARVRQFPLQRLLIENPVATWLRRRLVPQALRDRVKEGRQMKTRPRFTPSHLARLHDIFERDYEKLRAICPPDTNLKSAYHFVAHD